MESFFQFWQFALYGDFVTGGPWYGLPSFTLFFAIVVAVDAAAVRGRVMTLTEIFVCKCLLQGFCRQTLSEGMCFRKWRCLWRCCFCCWRWRWFCCWRSTALFCRWRRRCFCCVWQRHWCFFQWRCFSAFRFSGADEVNWSLSVLYNLSCAVGHCKNCFSADFQREIRSQSRIVRRQKHWRPFL